jgi:prephenate dehydrogenase
MSTPQSLSDIRVAILGLGLMGGSLAMALGGHCRELLAYDPDPRPLTLASKRRIVDYASADLAKILPQANLVVLAAPVRASLKLIQQLPSFHPGTAVILDLASTKTEICQAYEDLPARFDPIGGHPMCGKETAGLPNAEAGLFQGAAFALTPLERTSPLARSLAVQLVEIVGARPIWLDAATHDRWTATTSHMPYLLAVALTLATPPDCAPLIGPGFRSTSRLASSPATMMADILHTNRENVLAALVRFRNELDQLETSLRQEDETQLYKALQRSAAAKDHLIHGGAP